MNRRPLAVDRATVYSRFHCFRHFTIVVIVECDLLVALFDSFGLFLTVCLIVSLVNLEGPCCTRIHQHLSKRVK
ncbi:hypothetical protein MUK42_12234 [Musa troglodytarum]|uniref:Uncharacterized protein n=1 Tax=Musa troglodytarum TaxID=320322 RepID=A0A9E7GCP2_9LILI|nr:hypothetical protein MUK42_21299 [Musa troglodytarum]URE12235.1 hypothetical protein MUK42_12234 [Musa troglodytarum]